MYKSIQFLLITIALLVIQNAFAEDATYSIEEVSYKNLVAELYLPKSNKPVPVVIAFGGSEGGIGTGKANGEMIAPHGVAVLALAYFDAPGISKTLDQIPLEYFLDAIDYVATHKRINVNRIGVVAGSRGSEAAFLMASLDKRIKSVVVTTPSKVAWYGMTKARSAWTYQNKDIPALSLGLSKEAKLVDRFSVALNDEKKSNEAQFNFEEINGPILLISAEHDQVWPSYKMSNDIKAYLKSHKFKHAVIHNAYKTGHGFSQETAPEIKLSIINHFVNTL
jgi:dienelactone hydrolase